MHWGMDGVSVNRCRLWGMQSLFQAGKRGAKTALNLAPFWGCRRKNFSNPNPKPKIQSNFFYFPAISRSKSCLSNIAIIPFAGSGSPIAQVRFLRARRISAGGGKFDFANRLNGVGKFAFCGGSDRLQYCGICAFRGVPYLPARGKFPGCRAVAVSHSELRISFCSAVKNISKAKSGH